MLKCSRLGPSLHQVPLAGGLSVTGALAECRPTGRLTIPGPMSHVFGDTYMPILGKSGMNLMGLAAYMTEVNYGSTRCWVRPT